MKQQASGNLHEILRLRLRLREPLRFFSRESRITALRPRDGQQFELRPWQQEMLMLLDGSRNFGELARQVHQESGGFTSAGLLNFYQWLHQEDMIFCECESVFELVGDEDANGGGSGENPSVVARKGFATTERMKGRFRAGAGKLKLLGNGMVPRKEWQRRALKVSAVVVFGLSTLRLAYVAAPVFEPPVNRAYAAIGEIFGGAASAESLAQSSRTVPEIPVKEMELAGQVESVEVVPSPDPANVENARPASAGQIRLVEDLPVARVGRSNPELEVMEELRRRLSECRIRRDEFYLQNNEAGYREEVEKMTEIAREIGEIEARL